MSLFYKLQFLLCAINFGAIVFVQVVHYPLFRNVGTDFFNTYHKLHVSKTTLLLGTTLFLEMIITTYLLIASPSSPRHLIPFLCLMFGWGVTFFFSVPQHSKLESGFDHRAHERLLFSNLMRVCAWGSCLIFIFIKELGA